MHHRTSDIASAYRDQAVGLEQVDRLSQGGRGHPELREQPLLGGQDVALLESAGQNVIPQPGRDKFCDPGLANAV